MVGRRLWFDNCGIAITVPSTAETPVFEDIKIINCDNITQRNATIRRFTAQMRAIGAGQRRVVWATPNQPCGILEDGVIKFPQSASTYLTDFAPSQGHQEALGSPTLRRVTITPCIDQASLSEYTQRYVNYVFEGVAGFRTLSTTDPNSSNLLYNATIINSYVGPTKGGGVPLFANLAEYSAKVPGVMNDVVMFNQTKPITFAGDPLVDPTITGPAEILNKGMGVDPTIILSLPAKLSNIPTLQSMGYAP